MKPYWLAFSACIIFTVIIFVFFWLSLPVRNDITFTDLPNITQPTVTFIDESQGDETAIVRIVLFGDYGCPSCVSVERHIRSILDNSPFAISYTWKDLVLEQSSSSAYAAALAARCAGKQDRFWELHDALMVQGNQLNSTIIDSLAANLDIRTDRFSRCMNEREVKPLLERDVLEAEALQIVATPTVFVNDLRVTGLVSETDLRAMVAQAAASPS